MADASKAGPVREDPTRVGGGEGVPVVKVALATYNGMPWLPTQVQTILDQVGVEVELYASDDGSSDQTVGWLGSLAGKDPRVTLLPKRSGPAGVAANFLYALANLDLQPGQYAAFTDQDDLWQPNKLVEQIDFMAAAGADAVSSNVMAFETLGDGNVVRTLIRKDQPQVEWDFIFEAPGAGSTYVFNYHAWLTLVTYLEKWGAKDVAVHDWFVYAVVRASGLKWAIDPRPHVAYRQHSRNVAGAHKGLAATVERWKLLRSGHYRKQFILTTQVAIQAARDAGRCEEYLTQLEGWEARLSDTSLPARLDVLTRAKGMRRRPLEQVSLSVAGLLGVW